MGVRCLGRARRGHNVVPTGPNRYFFCFGLFLFVVRDASFNQCRLRIALLEVHTDWLRFLCCFCLRIVLFWLPCVVFRVPQVLLPALARISVFSFRPTKHRATKRARGEVGTARQFRASGR